VTTKKRLGAFFTACLILTNLSLIDVRGEQHKKDDTTKGKTSGVIIKEEKGPSGHSTIGIDENSIDIDPTQTLALTFASLMRWEYDADSDTPPPEKVAELDGRRVRLTGFMYPLQQGDPIQYFCLLRTTQTCCYGPRPQFNQYVFVEMDAPTQFYRLDPVSCAGTFRVEPMPDEGYIYRIEGEKCEAISKKSDN
jgi:hypothetical protein